MKMLDFASIRRSQLETALGDIHHFQGHGLHLDLVGGEHYEPHEENPMIGWRGASRYYDPGYRDGFGLECRAIKRLREEMGFDNVVVMIPFCRTPEEADRVLEVMAEEGLTRGENGLQVYVMCEVPSNVILAEEFAKRFDAFYKLKTAVERLER